jgi:hypothetical protein
MGSDGQYHRAMSPNLSRYVKRVEAVDRFKASGGLLPLNPRLGRPRRQLRFPRSLVGGTVCGGESRDSGGSSGSGFYGDSNSGGSGVGDDGCRMSARGDRGSRASDYGGGGRVDTSPLYQLLALSAWRFQGLHLPSLRGCMPS